MSTLPHITIKREGSSSDSWCVNYNGLKNTHCKAEVEYQSVQCEAPHTYSHGREKQVYTSTTAHPCFKHEFGLTKGCEFCRFPTPEEIKTRREERMAHFNKMAVARDAIIASIGNKVGVSGVIDCPVCKTGKLRFSRAALNGHVHAACSTETCVRWME